MRPTTPQSSTKNLRFITNRGFTLIELLVVIAIIAVLTAIMLPALAKGRATCRMVREMSAARQLMIAFAAYADDNRGRMLVGYPPLATVAGPIVVHNRAGERLTGEAAQRYPWRIIPYLGEDFRALYQADRVVADLIEREREYVPYGINFDYAVSLYPSLGMNVAFVGGSDRHGEFDTAFVRSFGRVYLERIDEANRPSALVTFASARADPQPALPIDGVPQGFFRVEPPVFAASGGRRWADAYDARSVQPGVNSGFVSLRHSGKGVTARLDGHSDLVGWDEAGDMRIWSDAATRPDWGIGR